MCIKPLQKRGQIITTAGETIEAYPGDGNVVIQSRAWPGLVATQIELTPEDASELIVQICMAMRGIRAPDHGTARTGAGTAAMIPDPPGYWANETGPTLRPAVKRYLTGQPMSRGQVLEMRAYLRQWMLSPMWVGSMIDPLRTMVEEISTREDITRWLDLALREGIDPL